MKFKNGLIVSLLSLGLLLPLCGCGTNAPTKAAQADQVLITTVNDAAQQWALYVNAGKAKQSQIDRFKTAYDAYYTAQQAARATIEKLIAKDPTTTAADVATANQAVLNAENALVSLVNSYLSLK